MNDTIDARTKLASLEIVAGKILKLTVFWRPLSHFYIEHSDPKIAINFKSLYLEQFSFYWFDTLQEHLHLDMGLAGNLPAKNWLQAMPKIAGKFVIIAGKNLWMIFRVILDTFGDFLHDFSFF